MIIRKKQNRKYKKPKIQKIGRRTVARIIATQTLFQYHFNDKADNLSSILDDTIEFYLKDECGEHSDYKKSVKLSLAKTLIEGVESNIEELDKVISKSLKAGNTVDGVQGTLKEILRLAVFELQTMPETPTKVIINEYVNLTSYFGEQSQVKFANGILDNIAKSVRK